MTTAGSEPGRLAPLRGILSRRPLRRLLAAQLLSQMADGLYQIALAAVIIFDVSTAQTPAQVTKVLAVTLVPFSLVGPFTGPFIDRFSRRSILVGASVARVALTLALLPFLDSGPEWALLALAVANVSVNRFFHATKSAVLPTLVEPPQYLLANTTSSVVGMVFGLAGAVIGGPLADSVSTGAAVGGAAACMAGAAVLAATISLPRGERHGLAGIVSELRDNLRDVRAGLRVLVSARPATYAIAAIWSMRALLGFVLLAALVLLRSRLELRATDFSVILAAVGVGNFVGALVVPFLARRLGNSGVAPASFVVAGVATLIGGPIPAMPALLATVFVAGIAMATTKIPSDTLIQRAVPDRYRGRAFAVYDIGYNGAFVVAALISTLIRPLVADVGMVVVTGVLALGVAGALALARRGLPGTIEVRTYAGSRADEAPREVVLEGAVLAVAEVERSWHEDRAGERLLVFRLRLADGRRVQVSRGEEWRLDREMRG